MKPWVCGVVQTTRRTSPALKARRATSLHRTNRPVRPRSSSDLENQSILFLFSLVRVPTFLVVDKFQRRTEIISSGFFSFGCMLMEGGAVSTNIRNEQSEHLLASQFFFIFFYHFWFNINWPIWICTFSILYNHISRKQTITKLHNAFL
ncbi:hypothetical protein BD289DRAFT_435644 [Coniella lustricola]|uniref:Uncharacterized protein n=1 Tax=Coniella lustricola TaxID=2025994 RepID=A0A2T3A693_9PEZI|nr:hypothetical protein BD289DRAFT_435644 [Coniella lustricola]